MSRGPLRARVCLTTALLCAGAAAQSPDREPLIHRIEDAIGRPAPVPASSPLVTQALGLASRVNPNPDPSLWLQVRAETAAALTDLSSGAGSAFDRRVRAALESFDERELQALADKLSDPLLLKFREALKQQASRAPPITAGALELAAAVNRILAAHHLNTVALQ